MTTALTLAEIDRLAGGKIGRLDLPCPACGPGRRLVKNRRRRVMRLWRRDFTFASYNCARCGIRGHVRDDAAPIDLAQIERVRTKSAQQDQITAADKLRSALPLRPICAKRAASLEPFRRRLATCRRATITPLQ
jgi:DNA-directed RNA polymerase subunit RPC12/RpoP